MHSTTAMMRRHALSHSGYLIPQIGPDTSKSKTYISPPAQARQEKSVTIYKSSHERNWADSKWFNPCLPFLLLLGRRRHDWPIDPGAQLIG